MSWTLQSQFDSLCSNEDEYTNELQTDKGQALWHVELKNGLHIVQDDGRPGILPCSAWLRLRAVVQQTGIGIKRMWLQFRSHKVEGVVPEDADGYYFCKAALGILNSNRTLNFYLIGYLHHDNVHIQKWTTPSLILSETFVRSPIKSPDCLILNP